MKVLLVSQNENHAFLLNELEKEGQSTMLLSREDTGAWGGLVRRASNPVEAQEWSPDVAIFDGVGFAPLAERLSKEGVRILNGGKFHDRISKDFMFGMDLLGVNHVFTPDIARFESVSDAVEHIIGKEHPWLYRSDSGGTHSTQGPLDMQIFLESVGDEPFYLQRAYSPLFGDSFLARPEFFLAGMFNSKGLMNPCLYFQKSHNLLPEGLGVPTEEGVTLKPIPLSSNLVQKTLGALELSLKALGYTGWIFLGCIMDYAGRTKKSPRIRSSSRVPTEPMEIVPVVTECSSNPPAGFWSAFLRGLKMPFHLFLDRACRPLSRNTPYDFWPGWICSRKVTVPPYPVTEMPTLQASERNRLNSMIRPSRVRKEEWGIYWNCVRDAEHGMLEVVGPVVGYAAGRGNSQHESLLEVRNILQGLDLPCKQAKVEIDPVCEFDLPVLESWGFLGGDGPRSIPGKDHSPEKVNPRKDRPENEEDGNFEEADDDEGEGEGSDD